MKKKAALAQIKRWEAAFDKWEGQLGLGWWSITTHYKRKPDRKSKGQQYGTIARVSPEWPYRMASIEVFLPQIAELSDESLERAVVHEAMHILMAELESKRSKHEERVAESLTSAFMWTRYPIGKGSPS